MPGLTRRLSTVAATPAFVLSVVTLLLNDSVLKYLWPGWVTGKLSDVSGLFVVGLLTCAVSRRKSAWALAAVALAFTWWKSAYSQPMIERLDALGLPIGRTVDPTDLIALVMLLAAWQVGRSRLLIQRTPSLLRRAAGLLVGTATVMAIAGTTFMPVRDDFQIRKRDPSAQLDVPTTDQRIQRVLVLFGFHCVECLGPEIAYEKGEIRVRYQYMADDRGVRFVITGSPGSLFFGIGSSQEEMTSLELRLRNDLRTTEHDLEFVIEM